MSHENSTAADSWDRFTVLRKNTGPTTQAAQANMTVEKRIAAAARKGEALDLSRKVEHKQKGPVRSSLLDADTESTKHTTVSKDLSRAISKARNDAKMSQKDLASRINEKTSVIVDYETGKAIPTNAVITKLERALNIKLR